MADITRIGVSAPSGVWTGGPSLDTINPPWNCQVTGIANVDLLPGDACYILASGLIAKSIGTAANAAARVDGFAGMYCKANEPVTLFFDVEFNYGTGLTPGAQYYVSSTAGGGALSTTTTTGGTAPVASAVDATRIRVRKSSY